MPNTSPREKAAFIIGRNKQRRRERGEEEDRAVCHLRMLSIHWVVKDEAGAEKNDSIGDHQHLEFTTHHSLCSG